MRSSLAWRSASTARCTTLAVVSMIRRSSSTTKPTSRSVVPTPASTLAAYAVRSVGATSANPAAIPASPSTTHPMIQPQRTRVRGVVESVTAPA
jgi:hypothetical protein